MYYVYCLISKKKERFHYYGFTTNIDSRIIAHKKGKVRTTKRYLPIELLGYRTFKTKKKALEFEKDLKRKASYRRRFVKELQEKLGSPA
jgi:putative endonuclease